MKTLKLGNTLINLDYYTITFICKNTNIFTRKKRLTLELVHIDDWGSHLYSLQLKDYPEDWMQIIEDALDDSQD